MHLCLIDFTVESSEIIPVFQPLSGMPVSRASANKSFYHERQRSTKHAFMIVFQKLIRRFRSPTGFYGTVRFSATTNLLNNGHLSGNWITAQKNCG